MILVVGSTGVVGHDICRRLVERGERVRGLIRSTSESTIVGSLRVLGVDTVVGDVRDPASLAAACTGVDTVLTTVSAMPIRYIPGDNDIQKVDLDGQKALIDAAREARVGRFVYTSFSKNLDVPSPLRDAKRTVERYLRDSGMEYTILRPTCFQEIWLSPLVGFDALNAKATVYGDGTHAISYIASGDVAEFACRAIHSEAAKNDTIELGGPEAISQIDAVRIFERIGGHTFAVTHVPEEILEAQRVGATDPLQQTFPALMLGVARGDAIPMEETAAMYGVHLTPVTHWAERVYGKVPALA